MKYTEKDIKVGTKLRCTKAKPSWWTVGKIYEVSLSNDSVLQIIDDYNHSATQDYIIDCLNGEHQPVKFELFKEENNMQEFKVGDLVEVVKNSMYARNEFEEFYKKGDKEIVTGVGEVYIHIGDNMAANLVKREDIKKVETTSELTEYEEEIVTRLADKIKQKDEYIKELEILDSKVKDVEILLEDKQKEIDFEVKKLLTK